jgi:hypothetical protein
MVSKPARGMACMSTFVCVVLACVDRGLEMDRSTVPGVLSKYLKEFTVSEVDSELESVRGRNPWNVQQQQQQLLLT